MAVQYKIAGAEDIGLLVESRLDTLRDVNRLDGNYTFSEAFLKTSRDYFLDGSQDTALALENGRVVGCASMCYYRLMPTFSHPTGKRAHLMNVYTDQAHRRQGIASRLVTLLIDLAWEKGATEISLDATESGRPLYRSLGFTDSGECMVLENSRGKENV